MVTTITIHLKLTTGAGPSQTKSQQKTVGKNAASATENSILGTISTNTPEIHMEPHCAPLEQWLQISESFFPGTANSEVIQGFDDRESSTSESEGKSNNDDILPDDSDMDSDVERDQESLSNCSELFSDDEEEEFGLHTSQAPPETPHIPTTEPLTDRMHKKAPMITEALVALSDISAALKPRRKKGPGYKDPGLNPFVHEQMEGMAQLLSLFTNKQSRLYNQWIPASLEVAVAQRKGEVSYARRIRAWMQVYVQDCTKVPVNPYGKWNKS